MENQKLWIIKDNYEGAVANWGHMGNVIPIHMVAEGSFPFTKGFFSSAHQPRSGRSVLFLQQQPCWPASALRAAHCRCMKHESFRRPSDLLRTKTECIILNTTHTVAHSVFTRLTRKFTCKTYITLLCVKQVAR